MCLVYMVTCVHPLRVAVLVHNLLHRTVERTVVQCLYFKPRMSGSKHKSCAGVTSTAVLFKVLYCKIKNVFLGLPWQFSGSVQFSHSVVSDSVTP